ncbi:MAG: aminotransferase class I/II-fold pyridoxal phosphate-dependent enzyme [Sphingobacteriia bacterium]|nr:aminotransferase class I/II-fold pyridoxal phosphate-dependent enzyme [Sphingobacteriia bacterium]
MPYNIPVMRVKLPEASELIPYLNTIDQNAIYSNFGPLVRIFEKEIASNLNLEKESVVTVSNATLGIYAALQALNLPEKSYCLMPSWTFTATPAAAKLAGLVPYFLDVDINTKALTPEIIYNEFDKIPETISSVIVVCPFGAPINLEEWAEFQDQTGIKVVIDGAAAYDSFISGLMPVTELPFIVSLHATKMLGAGEGCFIASTDHKLIKHIEDIVNFGFVKSRESQIFGINAKMSEYTAAIGLASLKNYPQKKLQYQTIRDLYIKHLNNHNITHDLKENYVSTTCNIICEYNNDNIENYLRENGIETRRWWGNGCHTQPAYIDCPVGSLTNTEYLSSHMLGIPFFSNIENDTIKFITSKIYEFNEQFSVTNSA